MTLEQPNGKIPDSKIPSGDIPDNLPLLTQVVSENPSDDLPTLTEVIAQPDIPDRLDKPSGPQVLQFPATPADHPAEPAAPLEIHGEAKPFLESPIDLIYEIASPDLPGTAQTGAWLPDVTDEASTAIPETGSVFGEEQMQRLLQHLDAHIETVFAQKLNRHLEELQKIAVDQAINELKADLPELLRDALNAHLQSR